MADAPYLVTLALVEREGIRECPLAGQCRSFTSRSSPKAPSADPGEDGMLLALQLMLRLWQRSDGGPFRRAAGDDSLLLVELPWEVLSEKLPLLQTKWIWDGDTPRLINSLKALARRGWRLSIAKSEPVSIRRWW